MLLLVGSASAQYVQAGYNFPPVAGASPGFVGESSYNSTLTNAVGNNPTGQTFCSAFSYCLNYADTTLSGNLGIVSGHFANTTTLTPTATDDKSDTYTCTTGGSKDTGTNEWPFLCYSMNLASGAHKVTITFGTTGVTQVTAKAAQFYNIATTLALDGSIGSCAGASSATANCAGAAVTTTAANDLVYHLVCRAGTPAVTSFTAGTGFTLGTTDINDGCASQWEVASATGSVTPSMTMASASTYVAITAAFKSAAAGTAPTGEYLAHLLQWSSQASGSATYHVQFPSTGNLLYLSDNCGNSQPFSIATPSDTTNTWVHVGSELANSPVFVDEYLVSGATANSAGLISQTTTVTGTAADCTLTFYDFMGASATSVYGQWGYISSPAAASTVTATNLTPPDGSSNQNTYTGTPGPSSGVAVLTMGQGFNTSTGFNTPSACLRDGGGFGGMALSGSPSTTPISENNVFGHCYFSSGDQPLYVIKESSASTALNQFAGNADAVYGSSAFGMLHETENIAATTATLTITVPSTTSGNLGVVSINNFNSTARTVSKVCFDGTTCAAGNAFTQYTGAATTGSTSHGNTDVWYLLSLPAGKTTLTITLSGSASKINAFYYEMQKGTGTWATSGAAHTTNGTISAGHLDTGPSVGSLTGSNFCVAVVGTDGGIDINPNTGNGYVYGGLIYSGSDASASIITSGASAQPVWHDLNTSGNFNASNGCFK